MQLASLHVYENVHLNQLAIVDNLLVITKLPSPKTIITPNPPYYQQPTTNNQVENKTKHTGCHYTLIKHHIIVFFSLQGHNRDMHGPLNRYNQQPTANPYQ